MENKGILLGDASPNLLSVCKRTHTSKGLVSVVKHTYTYRLMYTISGKIAFNIGDKRLVCSDGGLLFLTPGLDYTTEFLIHDLEIYHLFFDITHFRDAGFPERFPKTGVFLPGAGYPDRGQVRFDDVPAFNSSFVAEYFKPDEPKFAGILREYQRNAPYSRLRMNASLTEILVDLARICLTDKKSGTRSALAGEISDYITKNITEPLTCASVATKFSYHPNYLNQVVREEYGRSLGELISDAKTARAIFLLDTTTMTVTEIAHELSYCDASYFDRVFVKKTGMRPKDRRKIFGQ